MQTAGKHKDRSFGENSRRQEGQGLWAKAKEKSKNGADKAGRARREHSEEAQVFGDKENIKEKMLPTSSSDKRAQSVIL